MCNGQYTIEVLRGIDMNLRHSGGHRKIEMEARSQEPTDARWETKHG